MQPANEPRGWEEFTLVLPTGIVHVSGVARRVLQPGSRGAPAPLLANEAPCPSSDYQSLLAHSAYFMHCLQETPPGNLYLQGWQTAISSITGWLRETEPIKWILESTGVFTSVPSKGEKKITAMLNVLHISEKKCTCYAEHGAFAKDARANMSRKRHR